MSKKFQFHFMYNSEDRIERAVKSVLWADEVVVVDSFSEDRTAEIAEKLGAKVAQAKLNTKLRLAGIKHTTHDWILVLIQMRRNSEAEKEIRDYQPENPKEAYHTPRQNIFMGQPIRFVAGIRTTVSRSFSNGER